MTCIATKNYDSEIFLIRPPGVTCHLTRFYSDDNYIMEDNNVSTKRTISASLSHPSFRQHPSPRTIDISGRHKLLTCSFDLLKKKSRNKNVLTIIFIKGIKNINKKI